ncbi:MAG TPA: class I adenylate-forming enzyme family protein [Gemmatimonadales bacterium]|nr:class I adenylate-forming enzyme family protein [Gemmatimonadales bacterium]
MFLDLTPGRLIEPLTGRVLTPPEIASRVAARGARYVRGGLGAGERVFLHFGNTAEFLTEVLAVWSAGGSVVPIDPRFTAFELRTLAEWARPRFSVWRGTPDAELRDAMASTGAELLDVDEEPGPASSPARGDIHLDRDAIILFTSGTTGQPKGVVHTHRSLRARWMGLRQSIGLGGFDRTLCLLPTHFGHGLICNCLYPWLSGRDLFLAPPFKPDLLADLGKVIDEHQITFLSSVPAVWRLALRLAKPPGLGSLQRVFIGSAPLTAQLWNGVRDWARTRQVLNAYGITETGSWLAGTTIPEFEPEDGLVGVPWGGVTRVLRSNAPEAVRDPSFECAPGDSGHVWVQTPALMRGYLDRDDLTAQVVSAGWFLTGDIGMIDDRGVLYLRGREREEINKGGMKVHPADVDSVVERFAGTLEVCCFGYADRLLGEEVGIAVVLGEGASLDDLLAWTRRHLAEHQVPQRWYLLEEIPRTSRGKVNRTSVAEQCASLQAADVRRGGR